MDGGVVILTSLCILVAGVGAYCFRKFHISKNLADTLSQQAANYESIICQANDALLVIDIVDGKILQCNPAAGALLHFKEEELLNKSLFDLHPPEYIERSSLTVADVWEKGGMVYQDIPFLNAEKEIVPVECSAKVTPFAGRPSIVIYARDISDRLKMEREIREKNRIIEDKSHEILDSITYARRLQRSILPAAESMEEMLQDHFVLYLPKDIVSGDFYWCASKDSATWLATIDCTGHGVPGAFMSMVGYTLLNQTLKEAEIRTPAAVLDFLNAELPRTLKAQDADGTIRDGMDMSLCAINRNTGMLHYACANNPIWIARRGEIIVLKQDKQAVTAGTDMVKKPFTDNSFALSPGDMIYLFTDGYADQFGGPRGKKFMYKQLAKMLADVSTKDMEVQREVLQEAFSSWKGETEQVDDVCVIGVRYV